MKRENGRKMEDSDGWREHSLATWDWECVIPVLRISFEGYEDTKQRG
jgi:hypothetical protein